MISSKTSLNRFSWSQCERATHDDCRCKSMNNIPLRVDEQATFNKSNGSMLYEKHKKGGSNRNLSGFFSRRLGNKKQTAIDKDRRSRMAISLFCPEESSPAKSSSLPMLAESATFTDEPNGILRKDNDYSHRKILRLAPLPRITSTPCIHKVEPEPTLATGNDVCKSDITLYRRPDERLISKEKSFVERLHAFTKSAKSAVVKAFSTERIYRPQKVEIEDVPDRSESPQASNKNKFSFQKKKKCPRENLNEVKLDSTIGDPFWDSVESSTCVYGHLLQMNVDDSQVIELRRPPGKSFGFFLAKGKIKGNDGVFVSRLHDIQSQKNLQGLLDVGDEILEVNGTCIKNWDIMDVNALISKEKTLLLTVLPYICRKDL